MSNSGERLRQERMRLDMSQEEFGAAGGVKKVAQSNYETGKRFPDSQYLEKVAALGVDIRYVVTGIRSDNSMVELSRSDRSGVAEMPEVSSDSGLGPGFAPIPMYDIEAAAGAGRLFDAENIESTIYFPTELLSAEGRDPANQVGAKVRGDSMLGTLNDGDRVLVDRGHRKPDGVFLLRMGNELRIKRIQRVAGGAWFLISDNERYEREIIKPEHMGEVEVIGECWIRIGRVS